MNILVQGSNRGIGLELVRALCKRADVDKIFSTTRRPEQSSELRELSVRYPNRVFIVGLDLTDESSMSRARNIIENHTSKLHGLMNVSGLLHSPTVSPERKLEHLELNALHEVFAVNTFGPILMAKYFWALMQHDERSVFASLSARVGSIDDNRLGGWYAYRSSKAAQNMMTKTLSIELARRAKNVICVGLHPGTVDTDLSKPFQRNVPSGKLFSPSRAAEQLLGVVDSLSIDDSGKVFDWQGKVIPW